MVKHGWEAWELIELWFSSKCRDTTFFYINLFNCLCTSLKLPQHILLLIIKCWFDQKINIDQVEKRSAKLLLWEQLVDALEYSST